MAHCRTPRGSIVAAPLAAALLSCSRAPAPRDTLAADARRDAGTGRSALLIDAARDDAAATAPPAADAADAATADAADAATADAAHASIRSVDWCNRGYGTFLPTLSRCRGSTDVRHRAGEGIHSIAEYRLGPVAYGDMTGDGREDALVVLEGSVRPVLLQNGGPQPNGFMLVAETRGNDLFVYPATPTGDLRIVRTSVARGVGTVVRRRGAGECTERWRLVGAQLERAPGGSCGAAPP